MKNDLAPTYAYKFGEYWVLWYAKSNNYSVVSLHFKALLDAYLESKDIEEFQQTLQLKSVPSNLKQIGSALLQYLEHCNTVVSDANERHYDYNPSNQKISRHYLISGKYIEVNFDSQLVEQLFHPALAYLEVTHKKHSADTQFDIYLENNDLCLFKNKALIKASYKKDYHFIQGKFIFEIINTIHDKKASDWLATFHGSTITDGINAILLIGNSGKGKSTLSSLLASHGFYILADDVTPLGCDNQNLYYNPSAVSVKSGAFKVLKPYIQNLDDLATISFNTIKGALKYIPFPKPKDNQYPCSAIIMVNYSANSETELEKTDIKTVLEVLISESWLSPNPKHAKQLLDWLQSIALYQLHYSDTASVVDTISHLFKTLDHK